MDEFKKHSEQTKEYLDELISELAVQDIYLDSKFKNDAKLVPKNVFAEKLEFVNGVCVDKQITVLDIWNNISSAENSTLIEQVVFNPNNNRIEVDYKHMEKCKNKLQERYKQNEIETVFNTLPNHTVKKSCAKWSNKDTIKFYFLLHTIGADFSQMKRYFSGKSLINLKNKYMREKNVHPHMLFKALSQPLFPQYDTNCIKMWLREFEQVYKYNFKYNRKNNSEKPYQDQLFTGFKKPKLRKKYIRPVIPEKPNGNVQMNDTLIPIKTEREYTNYTKIYPILTNLKNEMDGKKETNDQSEHKFEHSLLRNRKRRGFFARIEFDD